MSTPLFDRIDTVILRVADYATAAEWYRQHLGFEPAFDDPGERLVVLSVGDGTSLTLWEWKPGEKKLSASTGTFPIFATSDAAGGRERLAAAGVRCSELTEGEGVRYFTFWDVDSNKIEACEVTS